VDDPGEHLVARLLLEDDERGDDRDAGLDHRRELAREDLQRLRVDPLERGRAAAGRGLLDLLEPLREQAAQAQLLARLGEARGADLPVGDDSLGADRAVGERGH
jgi:hypothetical protein